MKDLVLFTYFNGVTHPRFSKDEDFKYKDTLEKTIRHLMTEFNVKIVISSSVTSFSSIEYIKKQFSPDIGNLIIDDSIGFPHQSGHKLKEVKYWMKTNKYSGNWLAIDRSDDKYAWTKSYDVDPRIVLVENGIFSAEESTTLIVKASKYLDVKKPDAPIKSIKTLVEKEKEPFEKMMLENEQTEKDLEQDPLTGEYINQFVRLAWESWKKRVIADFKSFKS